MCVSVHIDTVNVHNLRERRRTAQRGGLHRLPQVPRPGANRNVRRVRHVFSKQYDYLMECEIVVSYADTDTGLSI